MALLFECDEHMNLGEIESFFTEIVKVYLIGYIPSNERYRTRAIVQLDGFDIKDAQEAVAACFGLYYGDSAVNVTDITEIMLFAGHPFVLSNI